MGTMKYSGKSLASLTVMKLLVIVDSSEEEPKDISYVELSHDDNVKLSDKQICDVTEDSCAVGDNTIEEFDKFVVYKPLYSNQYRVKPFPEVYS
jgi:hypothetical protein